MKRTVTKMLFRNTLLFPALVVLLVLLFFSISPVAFANDFNGGYRVVSNNGGAATIETQNPYVSLDVSAWVMTFDRTSSYKYAQVGWVKSSYDSKPYYFYEVSNSTTNHTFKKLTSYPTVSNHYNYTVGCDSTYMYYKVGSTELGKTLLSSYSFTRNAIQVIGETQSSSDQCPGSTSNPVTMGSVQYKSTSNTWTSTSCSRHSSSIGSGYGSCNTMRNNIATTGSSSWEIWDSRY